MITKTTRRASARPRTITAATNITANVRNREAQKRKNPVMASLSPAQQSFVRQIASNIRRSATVTAATNTTNIMARPDFLELLPLFVQKLLILDVYGSVAMKSRHQIIPYFKFVAENTKGETKKGTIISSPFVNRQGQDENWTGRVVKNEGIGEIATGSVLACAYTPVIPGSVTISLDTAGVVTKYVDNGAGTLVDASTRANAGFIDYSTGEVDITGATNGAVATATYQYDNENVGPRHEDENYGYDYGAQMAKGYLQLDEFDLTAEAHELACYWSVFSAFAAKQEYGANIGDIAKEAAFSELTAEINTKGFKKLEAAAAYQPQFNWDASPVLSGAVVPHDYLNMFKLKLGQAAASIYQKTRLTRPNRLVVGTNVAEYIGMLEGFKAEAISDTVGPYKLGTCGQFTCYVAPDQDPNKWVMSCKNDDIRRNSALFGEYMPFTNTDALGMANSSVQQGYATMYAMEIVNPDTVVSGKILGTF